MHDAYENEFYEDLDGELEGLGLQSSKYILMRTLRRMAVRTGADALAMVRAERERLSEPVYERAM